MEKRYRQLFPVTLIFAAVLILLDFLLDEPDNILPGLLRIITMQDLPAN